MASPRRIEKLNKLLKEELSQILNREFEIPEGHLLTITRIYTSPDAYYATVFVSIIGANPKLVLKFLQKNIYQIQQFFNKKVHIRPVPRILFKIDEEEVRRQKVEKSLAKIK